jgi:glycosyltransferase involved in cell wall biosynthesis
MGIDQARIVKIPCGVDFALFQNTEVDRIAIRRKYNIPEKAFAFISVGRNHPKKGFRLLIEAAAALRQSVSDPFSIVLVGKEMEPLSILADKLGVSDDICLAGEIGSGLSDIDHMPSAELIGLYKSCDALAYPSLIETFAVPPIEAMSAEIPVITSNGPGCEEVVGDAAFICQKNDVQHLSDRMRLLMTDKAKCQDLVAQGKQLVQTTYQWPIVIKQWEELCHALQN